MQRSPNFRLRSFLLTGSLIFLGSMTAAIAGNTNAMDKVQVRGLVDSVKGDQINIKSREGNAVTIDMVKGWTVSSVAKASVNDIKQGDFVGIASLPKSGGGNGALEVLIFPAQLKGLGEGSYSWDLKPGSSMTNATVANNVKSVKNSEVTVTYHGHEKKITIPQGTPVVTLASANMTDIKPGTAIFVPAEKDKDGKLSAKSMVIGKNGVVPPM